MYDKIADSKIKIFDMERWDRAPVILYGCGEEGKKIASQLMKNGMDGLIFCDKCVSTFFNRPVISPQAIVKYPNANIIIESGKYLEEIYNELRNKKIERIFIYSIECYSDKQGLQKGRAKIEGGWYLYDLDFVVTEYCTLKCKNCVNGIPYNEYPSQVNTALAMESLNNFLDTGCYIADFTFIGGEPFLNQDLIIKVLETHADNSHIGRFITISNGTILPKPPLLAAMKKCKRFTVYLSDYGELSNNLELVINILKEENIDFVEASSECVGKTVSYAA